MQPEHVHNPKQFHLQTQLYQPYLLLFLLPRNNHKQLRYPRRCAN